MKSYIKRLLIALPVCFCAGVGIMSLVPKYYTSTFIIARESEQAVEVNRAITLNQPGEYDLGLARTDNAVHEGGYDVILRSDAFLYDLLGREVSTMDGKWHGTLGEYLNRDRKDELHLEYDSVRGWYSRQAVETIKTLRGAIKSHMDFETHIVTVTCTANDPLIATQIARMLNESLLRTVDQYEQDKMGGVLAQIKARAEEAETAYEQAKAQGAANQESLGEIARSFSRQQVVYEAQMIHHPAYFTLQEPTVTYRKAGPSRWMLPLLLTLLLGAGIVGWEKRDQIILFIRG